jgi:hypothetical protein
VSNYRKRSRASAFALGSVLVLALFGIGGGALALSAVSSRARALPSVYAQAREAGLAVSLEDLKRVAREDEDAAPSLERAIDSLRASDPQTIGQLSREGNAILGFRASPLDERCFRLRVEQLEEFVSEMNRAADLPDRSVDRPEVRFDRRSITPGEALSLAVMIHAAEAILKAERGDIAGSVDRLDRGLRTLRLLREEPSFQNFGRQVWSEIRLQRAAVRLVQENKDRTEAWDALRSLQADLGPVPSARAALAADLALALDAIRKRKEEAIEQLPLADAFKDMGRADIVRIFIDTVRDLPDASEDYETVERVLQSMNARAEDAPIYGGYARGYESMAFALRDVVTRRRLVRCALAFHDRPDSAPDEIVAALGADGVDPHSGEPLKTRVEGDTVVFYSVGRDRLDDGGREEPPERMGVQTRDVIFAVPRPQVFVRTASSGDGTRLRDEP